MGKISAQVLLLRKASAPVTERLELACPAHNFTSLRAAIENGANSVYIEYFPTGRHPHLRTSLANDAVLRKGIRYAHQHKVKIVLSFSQSNTDTDTEAWTTSTALIRDASNLKVDAIVLSDPALMLYTTAHYPNLAIHYAVAQTTIDADAIRLMKRHVPIVRVILPRVISVAQIKEISTIPGLGVELVGFGKGCTILTPRTALFSRPATPTRSAAFEGVSHEPFHYVDSFHDEVELCGLPGQATNDQLFHSAQHDEWHALNVLPQLAAIHVRALRIELPDHSFSRLARLTRVWREAIDECLQDTQHYNVRPVWLAELKNISSST